ncbi:MAG: hypothetical protein JSR77_00890 [Planctomycetes bacterium]|nr:hypothetical protein [Planctomycetota bacterium]
MGTLMRKMLATGLVAGSLIVLPAVAQPTSKNSISLQAKLTGVADGTASLAVKFYDSLTGGAQVGPTITLSAVPVQGGIVSVPVSPVDAFIFNGATRYMGISVNGGVELLPRTLVTSVPYAMICREVWDQTGSPLLRSVGNGNLLLGPGSAPTDYSRVFINAGGPDVSAAGLAVQRSADSMHPNRTVAEFIGGSNQDSVVIRTTDGDAATLKLDVHGLLRVGPNSLNLFDIGFGRDNDPIRRGLRVLPDPDGRVVLFLHSFQNTPRFLVQDGATGHVAFQVDAATHVTQVDVLTITGADVAEPFKVSKSDSLPEPQPGMVVSIDPANAGNLVVCSTPYDKKVAGAISGAGGLSVGVVMGKDNADPLIAGDHPVAMSGRVYVLCDATSGAIKPGDRLTTSNTPGHAMKVSDETEAPGAVIGKAMTELKEGKGLVLVLVNLQ